MITKKYDTLVFCGRFQPFHLGHQAVIDSALEHANEVVVVLGSSFAARSIKNPFTFEERSAMIRSVYPTDTVKIVGVPDYPYDDNAWVSAVQTAVDAVRSGGKTGLIGHSKDSSSYYLKIFPNWRNHVEVANLDGINATDIRAHLMSGGWNREKLIRSMPLSVIKVVDQILYADEYGTPTVDFDGMLYEYDQVQEYRKTWESAPYEPTFVTTDAVLHQSGHVLLIKRGGFPYKDCWALPGGYLAKGHFIEDNMVKELREETCVKVPEKVLKGSIKQVEIFDHPDRDPRGRTITHGFFVDLGFPDEKLPRVKGADDAAHAEWVPLSKIKSEEMAFDHWHILKRFVKTY